VDIALSSLAAVFSPTVLLVILASAVYGLAIGAIPGLTATMATALLVPLTLFADPIISLAAIVTSSAMAIFAGDIPGALLRIPGTPASAAYVDDTYQLRLAGKLEVALGINVLSSAVGGIIGTTALVLLAPQLAEIAIQFSSYEYFWFCLLGLSCAALVANASPLKSTASVLLGLLMSTVGLDAVMGQQRFTFGSMNLMAGLSLIAVLVGLFAMSELLRKAATLHHALPPPAHVRGSLLKVSMPAMLKNRWQTLRGSVVGTVIGILPGAGSDVAAWVSYSISKRFSRTPERFGHGHEEGVIEASAANNASLSGAYVPTLVFGVPGDTITAIVIGVLLMQGITPGPMVFVTSAELVSSLFIIFFIANVLMIPLGIIAIRASRHVLGVDPRMLYPILMSLCIVGTLSVNNLIFDLWIMLAAGLLAWFLEKNDYPLAPLILGFVLGRMVEDSFLSNVLKGDGNPIAFVNRPMSAALACVVVSAWSWMIFAALRRRHRNRKDEADAHASAASASSGSNR